MLQFISPLLALILVMSSSTVMGSWTVGNGGDGLRLAFKKAKESTSYIILKLNTHSFERSTDSQVVDWILKNQTALALDVMASQHRWTPEEQATCAWTTLPLAGDRIPKSSAIDFSYPTCRKAIDGFSRAGELLIHESVHHFGLADEEFADAVAIAIVKAWNSGRTEWIKFEANQNRGKGPAGRKQHSAVWTGSEMIIFGGLVSEGATANTNQGFRFDPKNLTWSRISNKGAPKRHGHTALWTGDSMIIWGGFRTGFNDRLHWQNSGAVWDAEANKWTPLIAPFGPEETEGYSSVRLDQTAVWTGDSLIVWGGLDDSGNPVGSVYNPTTGKWKKISSVGAPIRLWGHSAVWLGDKMLVWGGVTSRRRATNSGAIYDPIADSWQQITTKGAPRSTERHTVVSTGSKMIVLGGYTSSSKLIAEGGVYDLASDKWETFSSESILARVGHTALWDGANMLVFGGKSKRYRTFLNNVSKFSPETNAVTSSQGKNGPSVRQQHTAVWTGNSIIVWGGAGKADIPLADGGIYYP